MKFYLGVTDTEWFSFLKKEAPEEVNFWQPSGRSNFKVLSVGGPFLFKLKAPLNAISGIGWFASHSILPLSVAWNYFNMKNGVASFEEFHNKITQYRRDNTANPSIGCIILTDPVFFDQRDWIPVPDSWANSIVQGKSYDTSSSEGRVLWSQVQYTLKRYHWMERSIEEKDQLISEPINPEYKEILSKIRIGQGTFRTMITNAYNKKCAITREKTLPVLEASHIKPYAQSGPHRTNNGLLLRSDLHALFDTGYMTITPDHHIEVSKRIREEFDNGREYYRFQGQKLFLPEVRSDQPDPKYLTWHNDHIYRG